MSQINKKWLEGVGQADGLAELDQDGVIPQQQLPAAVNNEPATRQAADEALSDRLDVLEADPVTKTYVDGEVSDLQGQIDAEESARVAADQALDARLDVLEADPVTKTYVNNQEALDLRLDGSRPMTGGLQSKDITPVANGVHKLGSSSALFLEGYVSTLFGATIKRGTAGNLLLQTVSSGQDIKLQPNTGYNVDVSNSKIKNLGSASVGTDAVNKNDLDAAVAAEAALRASAVSAEQSARVAAVSAEQSARIAADQGLQSDIDQEILDRQSAISGEQSAREAGDVQVLEDAQAYSDQKIVDLKGGVSSAYDTLKKIEDKIEFITSNVDGAALDSLTEIVSAFQSADSTINGAISSLAASAAADLDAEEAARIAADSALDARLDILEADPVTKSYVDAQIPDNTDGLVEGSSNKYFTEARAKTAAVVNSMGGSQTDQAPSVAAIKSYISGLTHPFKDKIILNSGHISAGFVDLSYLAIENTMQVFANRLALHGDEDFTVSVVGGKTRITFGGEVASGGSSALEVGDIIRVNYSY